MVHGCKVEKGREGGLEKGKESGLEKRRRKVKLAMEGKEGRLEKGSRVKMVEEEVDVYPQCVLRKVYIRMHSSVY
jgi:hypothetical protein